jgi:hypothetical protein
LQGQPHASKSSLLLLFLIFQLTLYWTTFLDIIVQPSALHVQLVYHARKDAPLKSIGYLLPCVDFLHYLLSNLIHEINH